MPGTRVFAGDEPLAGPPVTFSEVSSKVVKTGDHQITLVRVRRPVFPAPPPPPPQRTPTPEEIAREEAFAQKDHATLNVTATVYLDGRRTITALRWRDESGKIEYRAYSNADFRYLTQLYEVETATIVYFWFPFVDVWDLARWPADQVVPEWPQGLTFTPGQIEYLVDASAAGLASEATTLAGLDHLHAYYQIHYAELKADYEKREVENAAREKHLRENPPVKPDTTVRFWPIKSRVNAR